MVRYSGTWSVVYVGRSLIAYDSHKLLATVNEGFRINHGASDCVSPPFSSSTFLRVGCKSLLSNVLSSISWEFRSATTLRLYRVWEYLYSLPHLRTLFTALHWMQGDLVTRRLSVRPSVHPSVCWSNAWFVTKRKKLVPTFLYDMKNHPWNFGSSWSRWSENANFQSTFARSASAVTARNT